MTSMTSFSEFLASKLILGLHFSSLACIEPSSSLVLSWNDEMKVWSGGVGAASKEGDKEGFCLVNKGRRGMVMEVVGWLLGGDVVVRS
ncbi:hypothetical protein Tco_1060360 [Tanacetum coccineum]